MSISVKAISSVICRLINTIDSNETAIVSQQGPIPNGAFASVHLLSVVDLSKFEQQLIDRADPDPDIDETISYLKELMFSINFFRDEAMSRATRFSNLLPSETAREVLHASGLGVGKRGTVRNLTAELSKRYEERAQLDLTFYVVDYDTLLVRSVESVEIDSEIQAEKIIQDTLIIP